MGSTGTSKADAGSRPEAVPAPGFTLGRVVALLAAIGITVAIVVFRQQLAHLAAYGYLGVFIVSMLGNATVFLPVPSLLAVFAGGTAFNPLITGLVAGAAEPLGELTGYLAGVGGQAVIENLGRYPQLRRWMARHGFITILVLAALPNPLFDVAGLLAGAMRMPAWKFLLSCWLGKTLKALAVAYLGAQSVRWLGPLLGPWGGG